jgi:sugar (pentulose or hexulose) kinase
VAGGVWPDTAAAVRACVEVRGEVEPDPAWVGPYAEGRERFRALYPALRAVG